MPKLNVDFILEQEPVGLKTFRYRRSFALETGGTLEGLEIGYHTYGKLNSQRDNVIWVCHALTANSDVADWWAGIFGPGCILDPERHFIVCANILGSCYGTTGPLSLNPKTGQPYYQDFPFFTVRDMVAAHSLLKNHLKINSIHLGLGGSMGGGQLLEWSLLEPGLIQNLAFVATNAKESPWAIALHTAQRMAIEADQTWGDQNPEAAKKGLKAARAMGILSYRNYHTFEATQMDNDERLDDFRASSYQYHQGQKLADRFNSYSYYTLLKALDTHNLGRGRKSLNKALKQIISPTILIGIKSDILYPLVEQKLMARHIPDSELIEIDSVYGHDGFLVETGQLNKIIGEFMANRKKLRKVG